MSYPPPVDQSKGVDFTGRDAASKFLLNAYAEKHGLGLAEDDWAEWRSIIRKNDTYHSDMAATLAHETFILAVDFIGPTLNMDASQYDMKMIYKHVDRYRAAQVKLDRQITEEISALTLSHLNILAIALTKADLTVPATRFSDDQLRLLVDVLVPWMTEMDLLVALEEDRDKLIGEVGRLQGPAQVQTAEEAGAGQVAILVEGFEKIKASEKEKKEKAAAKKAKRKSGKSRKGN